VELLFGHLNALQLLERRFQLRGRPELAVRAGLVHHLRENLGELPWEDGKQTHRGYRAQNLVTVRLADPTIAGRLIEGSIARAKASVRGPIWWIAPGNEARLAACRQAAAEAKRKAEAYADALGLHLGDVAEIREPAASGGIEPRPLAGPIALRAAPEPSLEVDPGELEVKAQVEVTFHLDG
jgi:uncharacterized protein